MLTRVECCCCDSAKACTIWEVVVAYLWSPSPLQVSDRVVSAQLWLVAVDASGNAQDDATLIPLKTLPDTTPPALLLGSGADDVSLFVSVYA